MLIEQGEHQQLDFKFEVSDSKKIARTLSAFANTDGGRLLIGVKDNGNISGIRSEEEYYMIEAASTVYTRPQVDFTATRWEVNGKTVLEVYIAPGKERPYLAPDKEGDYKAYIRVADENILATPVHLALWKHSEKEEERVAYTEREQHLLHLFGTRKALTLSQCVRLAKMPRRQVCTILADFIRFGLVEQEFKKHTFCYKLT